MASRRIILLLASAVAVFVVSTSSAPATLLPGPISRLRVVSRTTLRPGVILTHYRANVRGYSRAQEIYRISWPIGDTHVTFGSGLLGTYHPASETVDVHPVSSLGAPAGLLAAINGDYSAYTTRSAYRNRNAPSNRNENGGCRVVFCLHFRTCLTGGPRIDPFTDGPSVVPEVLTLSLCRRRSGRLDEIRGRL